MNVKLTGIIRGAHSEYGDSFPLIYGTESRVIVRQGNTLESVIGDLVLDEWIFTLRVNGRRVKNPTEYVRRKGVAHG